MLSKSANPSKDMIAPSPPAQATNGKPKGPSSFEMYKYSQTEEGKDMMKNATTVANSDVGKKAGTMAWEHRDQIKAAAQSEAGKKAMAAAWEKRDTVAKGAKMAAGAVASQAK
jgi:hypothetical protein